MENIQIDPSSASHGSAMKICAGRKTLSSDRNGFSRMLLHFLEALHNIHEDRAIEGEGEGDCACVSVSSFVR